jgi:hypothetical protein
MKILIIALAIASLLPQQQLKKEKQTLIDFRTSDSKPGPPIPVATQRAVLSKVFRRYLSDESKCDPQFDPSGNADPLKAARNAGQIVPSIADSATGSFTAAGLTQTAYIIAVSECNATHADNFGTKRIAIFSGQQLVVDLDADFHTNIVMTTDLNSDGINELLMTTGDMNQGTLIETASLVSLQSGRRKVIEEFGTVVEDSCASGSPGSNSKAALISISDVVPGEMPKLKQDNYVSSCRNVKRWRFVSTGRMQ